MPSKKPFFKPDVEEKILEFFDCYDSYVKNLVDSAEDPENRQHLQKLKNYTHNIILRRAGLETVTKCFGSRVVGTSIRSSNLNLYVDAGKHKNLFLLYLNWFETTNRQAISCIREESCHQCVASCKGNHETNQDLES